MYYSSIENLTDVVNDTAEAILSLDCDSKPCNKFDVAVTSRNIIVWLIF